MPAENNITIALIVGAISIYGLIREYLQYEKCRICHQEAQELHEVRDKMAG